MPKAELPKAELHCHIEGAATPALALEQARKYGVDTSRFIRGNAYMWEDFTSFIAAYDLVAGLFRTPEDYARLAETYLLELASFGTIYSELFVSPDHGEAVGLPADAYLEGLAAGMLAAREKTGIESRMTIIGERHLGPENVLRRARETARHLHRHPLVTGFNMAGDERMNRVADYVPAFDIARDADLGLTIHAGELTGPQSVADALDLVRPSRIGHGVRAAEDADLVRRLADLGTVLEVCPGSNIALQVFPDYESHPLTDFIEAGVRVTLNADDPPFFHTTLAMEYERAETVFGLSRERLLATTRTAIEAAFVDEETRARLLGTVRRCADEPLAAPRLP
ncbi:adenosine deaminase [Rhizobiaceae bacterium BDR2-2]|uniref:Adenine deaminase n=1 Tax=Ectorhizobium quercum TaxID=2965071 RepID=A0AAE3SU50_9HYPH|nr:adenosine deaminase [Ectorhizobium quercum]MCX8995679.1 adenosine deaminase [Ectorhizobium quercum]